MIYCLTYRAAGLVKIGCSEQPLRRFGEIQKMSPVPVILERVGDGGFAEERALHQKFSELRSHGEWFHISSEIEEFMEGLEKAADLIERLLSVWETFEPTHENVFSAAKFVGFERVAHITGYGTYLIEKACKPEPNNASWLRGSILERLKKAAATGNLLR